MRKKFLIIGAGRFGSSVAKGLYKSGNDVVIVDKDESLLSQTQSYCNHPVIGDATDDLVLNELDVEEFDHVIVSIGEDFKSAAFVVGKLKEKGCKMITTKAKDKFTGKLLSLIGANTVVYPEEESGERLARKLASPGILEYIAIAPDLNMVEIKAPKSFIGESLSGLNFRIKYRATVVLVIRNGKPLVSFEPTQPFNEGDILLVLGNDKDLDKLRRKSEE